MTVDRWRVTTAETRPAHADSALKPPRPDGRPGGGHKAERGHCVALAWVRLNVRAAWPPSPRGTLGAAPGSASAHYPHQGGGGGLCPLPSPSPGHPDRPPGRSPPSPHTGPSAPLVGDISSQRERERAPAPSPSPQPPAPSPSPKGTPPTPRVRRAGRQTLRAGAGGWSSRN